MLSAIEFLQGHGASARATATEGLELAQATGQRNMACFHLAVLARVAASFGTEDETRSLVTQCYKASANHRVPPIEDIITVALGEMELARGNAQRAGAPQRSRSRWTAPRRSAQPPVRRPQLR